MVKGSNRKSNIECLRIIAMLGILACHLVSHGVENSISGNLYWQGSTFNRFWGLLFLQGGSIGNAIFFMITGYFCAGGYNESFSINSVKKVVLETIFYAWISIFVTAVFFLIKKLPPNLKMTDIINFNIKAIFIPATGGGWWFVSTYLLLMLLTPTINHMIKSFSDKKYIIILLVFWMLWYSIASLDADYSKLQAGIFFYLWGGWRRTHGLRKLRPILILGEILYLIWLLVVSVGMIPRFTGLMEVALKYGNDLLVTAFFIPATVILLFDFFEQLSFESVFLNNVAKVTFGVYLFSDSIIARGFWDYLFHVDTWYLTKYFVPYAVGVILLVYIISGMVDCIRQTYVEGSMERVLQKAIARWEQI
ncbi:acyltransferase family protein [Butyrivibrio fibrisolvens]|uniref:acyltransferase family protein n=1 Tax=Butyrivibrio fibrisolvens TaxID=831 RepID=UPI000425EF7D|nr:acyltransferase [Butyrivibrio fibrisolvens]